MGRWSLGAAFLLVGFAGCRTASSKGPREAGSDLPVASVNSVALPGATDAADAPHAPSVVESRGANLTLYQDQTTGVSFRYPTAWRPGGALGLPAPEFSRIAGKPRMTQEFLPARTPYESTVLLGLGFSYTAQAGSKPADCAALPGKASPNAGKPVTVSYGGVRFTEITGGDAAMCTHVASRVDTTMRGNQCLVFERDLVTSCPYVKTATVPRPLTDQETAVLQRQLDAVMASVGITPP